MSTGDTSRSHWAEATAGLLFAAVGVYVLIEGMRLTYTIQGVPGPGFLPRWIAVGLIGTGLLVAIKALRPRFLPSGEDSPWPDALGWRRVAVMLAALAVSLMALESLGFLPTTILFMAVTIRALGARSWLMVATLPVLVSGVLYAVFAIWLRVPLPRGILAGFG